MTFIHLTSIDQLPDTGKYIIYKHSSCPISSRAKQTLKQFVAENNLDVYELHVVDQRSLSSEITTSYGIQHESPQVLIVSDGKVIAHESHFGIQREWLEENI